MTTIDMFSDGGRIRRLADEDNNPVARTGTTSPPRAAAEKGARVGDRPRILSEAGETKNTRAAGSNTGAARERLIRGFANDGRLLPYLLPVTLILLWQAGSSAGIIADRIMPAPAAVVAAFWERLLSGELAENIAVSGARAFAGLLVGGSIGFLLGIANGVSKLSEQLTDTTLQMLRTIPHLAMIPLVILWFGIGEEAKLFLTSLGVLFPVYLNTYHGVRNVDRDLVEMGRVYGMSSWSLFRKVIFPGALPSIFVGLRYALGIMWLTLIVSESIAANSGIGYMANTAREFMMTDVVVLSLVIYAILGKLADVVARTLERRALAWNIAYQK
ncbi:ABC transporter permease subunit [Neorhizobium sp. NCHU2750]|uniref:ABC transporter permease subunit n=1 Tax=Neorhizobium sp. NCHU2750 TaxID=1825976 RepID=UPI000EB67A6D|nr:sulfonate ABC transporter permease [Neorhizobium sp. NCHU2750]